MRQNKRDMERMGGSPDISRVKTSTSRNINDELALVPSQITDDLGAPAWFTAYENRISTKLSKITSKIDDVKEMATQAKEAAEAAMTTASQVQERVQELENDVLDVKADMCTGFDVKRICDEMMDDKLSQIKASMHTPNMNAHDAQPTPAQLMDHQVIVGGFDEDSDADEVIKQIQMFLEANDLKKKIVNVSVFSDPCNIGFIQFETTSAKFGFMKKISKLSKNLESGRRVWFTCNKTLEGRARDKLLGKLKHQLVTSKNVQIQDVKIVWKTGVVKVKGEKVADLGERPFELCTYGIAKVLHDTVVEEVKSWYDARVDSATQ